MHGFGWIVLGIAFTAQAAGRQPLALPTLFEANAGQFAAQVQFVARCHGYTALLMKDGVVFRSGGRDVRMRLAGADPHPEIVGLDRLDTRITYLIGDAPSRWATDGAAFSRIEMRGVYPGIDVIYSGDRGTLEYSFVVASGADSGVIQIDFEGGEELAIEVGGALRVETPAGVFRHLQPRSFEASGAAPRDVHSAYIVAGRHAAGFRIEGRDRGRPLTIDPTVQYSSYLGGRGSDAVTGLSVDTFGNLYITGWTESTTFPEGGMNIGGTSGVDAFIAKANAAGTAFAYVTYLGGSGTDQSTGVAADSSGNVVIAGWSSSANFPVASAVQTRLLGSRNAFVAKIGPAGTNLVFSTLLGGSGADEANAVSLDAAGNIYIAGDTTSRTFPTVNALQRNLAGSRNAFVSRFSPTGTLVYSTFLGGSANDSATAIAVDAAGSAYIAGSTWSPDLPVASAFQPKLNGGEDAFIGKLSPSGNSLLYCTYLGGSGGNSSFPEAAAGIAIDSDGNAYVVGTTGSADFPRANPFQSTLNGGSDAFVAKLNAAGTGLVYSTYIGGSSSVDNATAVAVDAWGDAYVAGFTASADFPVFQAIQASLAGEYDSYAVKLSPAGNSLLSSTYFGGGGMDAAYAVALDGAAYLYIAGETQSYDFPLTQAIQSARLAALTGFISKLPTGAPDFSVTVTSGQTVPAGNSALYTFTVTALNGFAGALSVNVSGLPSGASATCNPLSLTGGGAVTITVSTASSTPTGAYTLTISAVGNAVTHAVSTYLNVIGPAAISLYPLSLIVAPGETQQFTATATGLSDTAITWSISPQLGTISGTGLYTAPADVPVPQTVTISANSQALPALMASALVSVAPGTLYLSNMTILSGNTSYKAAASIRADTNFTVGGSANVTLLSGQTITLGPGFMCTAGVSPITFTASTIPGN